MLEWRSETRTETVLRSCTFGVVFGNFEIASCPGRKLDHIMVGTENAFGGTEP